MINKIKKLYKKYREIITYVFVGGTTTLVSILTYFLFTYLLNIDYMTSTILSWVIAVIYAYITNRLIVFKSKKKNIIKEFIDFVSCRILSLIIEIIIMYLLVSIFNIDKAISKIIVQAIIFVLNYIFSKVLVFRKKEK